MTSSLANYLSRGRSFLYRVGSVVRRAIHSLFGKTQNLESGSVDSAIRDWRHASYGQALAAIRKWFADRLGIGPSDVDSDLRGSLNQGETGVKLRALAIKDGLGALQARLAAALHHAGKLGYAQAAAVLRQRLDEVTWMIHQAARLAGTSLDPLARKWLPSWA